MRQKRMNILGLIYWAVAAVCFIICIWDVVIFGLFAPPVDIQHGIGVAMVCTLSEFALCGLMVLMGLDMRKKFTAKTFKFGLLMVAVSIFTLIFTLIGAYVVLPGIFGLVLAGLTLLALK